MSECEERIALAGGRQGAVVCSRATVGLAGALRALGLPKGSGVVMPVMVCANVVHAVRGAGLRPVFTDVEIQMGGIRMSMESGERVVDEGCRVLLAVPLFGGEISEKGLRVFAQRHELVIVEDAAQRGLTIFHRRDEEGAEVRRSGLGVCSVVSFGVGKV
ncbi:MAG: DegT/DnrJ/EryC1/StrS family aminotransferase, partial [Chloroflexia bacterium]